MKLLQQELIGASIDAHRYRSDTPIFELISVIQQSNIYSYHIVAICQAEACGAGIDGFYYRPTFETFMRRIDD